jgi:hypothetical protein
LAGYSVELVFKAVDKVISMITSKAPDAKSRTLVSSKLGAIKARRNGQKKQS